MLVGSSSVNSKHVPYMSMMIVVICVCFFAKSYSLECFASKETQDNFSSYVMGTEPTSTKNVESLVGFLNDHGFQISDLQKGDFLSLFTNMFVHVGLFHIAGNLLAFWAFAVALEQLFGSLKFTIFYLACGMVACVAQGLCDINSVIPIVGASGAVAGTMGAYVVLFGVLGKVKFWTCGGVIDIPAPVFALCWIGTQVMEVSTAGTSAGGVAIVSHLAGFGIGALVAVIVKGSVNNRITSENGELKIEDKQVAAPLLEEEILAQLFECQPFGTIVDALGNPDVKCPACDGTLDLLNPLGERLVRCNSDHCCHMTYVDESVLAGTVPADAF